MRRPGLCFLSHVENCEDCECWEPIPFHDRGGECVPRLKRPRIHQRDIKGEVGVIWVPNLCAGWEPSSGTACGEGRFSPDLCPV
jgi:hypothetical protein